MDVERLKEVSIRLFGDDWKNKASDALGVNVSTIRRWLRKDHSVPQVVEVALEALLVIKEHGIEV